MARLGDLSTIKSGYAFKSTLFSKRGIPIIRIGNITDDGLNIDYNICYDDKFYESNEIYRVSKGDILIAMSGATVGKSCINMSSKKLLLNQRVACISCNEGISKKYIYYSIISDKFKNYILKNSIGCAQPNISIKQLSNFSINLHSFREQEKIVLKLENIEKFIGIKKQQLFKLDELVKARFVEMFGNINKTNYDIKSLDEICSIIKDGTHKTPQYTNDRVGCYKFLSSKDVTTGKICWDNVKYIPECLHNYLYKRVAPKKGDILLAKNGTTGIGAIVDTDEVFDIYVSLALLRFKGEYNIKYIWMAINSLDTKYQFDRSLKGVGVPNLHLKEIKKTKIILPPIELQNEFAEFVEQVEKSKKDIQQSLEKLETLKKSLMQEYFG